MMELRVRKDMPCLGVQLRLAELELELGIAGYQMAPWEIFVESFTSIISTLQSVNAEFLTPFADGPSILPGGLRAQICRLSAQLDAMRILDASMQNLYRSLTSQQRQRAKRLLGPLCSELGSMSRSVS